MLVSTFVERALYATDAGFYESGGRAGRRGASFLTSVEVGPLFGAVIANAIDAWWHDAGAPDEWVVVDAGAGPGTLARTVAAAQPDCAVAGALRFVSVERAAAQRSLHLVDDMHRSTVDLPEVADVIFANELLDNLVFDLIERTPDGWVEVHVDADTGATTPDTGGPRVPTIAAAAAWIVTARARLRPGGRLVCLDYADTTAALARRPWTEWVRAFAGHERVDGPFVDPGSRDITVVVPWDQLPTPTSVTDQASWLRRHGIDDLVAAGRAYWDAHAAAPDVAALKMRSRPVEVGALVDPDGLGGFWVGEWQA